MKYSSAIPAKTTVYFTPARELSHDQRNRRRCLILGIAVGVSVAHPALAKDVVAMATSAETAKSLPALDAFVDTLIPADDLTPSASQLGVSMILWKQAESDPGLRQWLIEGLKWLDQGAPAGFARLDEPGRLLLVERLAGSPAGSQTRTFFEMMRVRIMSAYYADPRSSQGLAIDRPPQPIGYPDFAGAK